MSSPAKSWKTGSCSAAIAATPCTEKEGAVGKPGWYPVMPTVPGAVLCLQQVAYEQRCDSG